MNCVVRFNLDLGKDILFCSEHRFDSAERVICGMDIHSDF